jgi:tetraacyldisaccharide 4'-kinase
VKTILKPLAAGFKLGVALRREAYRRGWLETRRLNRPVISVGNLTVGGTGKTPLVALIVQRLLQRGWMPAILTRGYGRRRGADLIALEPKQERTADPREVGDEPALLAKKLPEVPIVVGADRYRAGRLAEDRFAVDVHVLDDGFQHLALARDVDVVLLDVTQELSESALLPAGGLREPASALERAHIVVLTRVDHADPRPLEEYARRINPQAVIFHASTKLSRLVDVATGRAYPPGAFQGEPVHAFCGIGNPQAFFADLKKWGLSVVAQDSFRDHYVYTGDSLKALAAMSYEEGREPRALLTTEKDAVSLPPLSGSRIPVVACVIETELDEPQVFEDALLERLAKPVGREAGA